MTIAGKLVFSADRIVADLWGGSKQHVRLQQAHNLLMV